MYQDAVKVPIGDWAKKIYISMTEKDFSKGEHLTNRQKSGRNVSRLSSRKSIHPHTVCI